MRINEKIDFKMSENSFTMEEHPVGLEDVLKLFAALGEFNSRTEDTGQTMEDYICKSAVAGTEFELYDPSVEKIPIEKMLDEVNKLESQGVANPLCQVWKINYDHQNHINWPSDRVKRYCSFRYGTSAEEVTKIDGKAFVLSGMTVGNRRTDLCNTFSYSVLDDNALKYIIDVNPKFVDVGAGSGYLVRELNRIGGIGVGIDDHPRPRTFASVIAADGPKTLMTGKFADHTLVLSWPPFTNHEGSGMETECLRNHKGDVIFIGEYRQSTGCDEFFDLLESDYELVKKLKIPQFPGIFDALYHFRFKN